MSYSVVPAIKQSEDWFTSEEVALFAMHGGWELALRPRLLFSLQKGMGKSTFVTSEYVVPNCPGGEGINDAGKNSPRADIALLDVKSVEQPLLLVELKHNYSFQLNEIERGKYSLRKDWEKWKAKSVTCPIQYVQLVTRITARDQAFFKYPREIPGRTTQNLKKIQEYFTNLQKEIDPGNGLECFEYQAEMAAPFPCAATLHFFVLTQGLP